MSNFSRHMLFLITNTYTRCSYLCFKAKSVECNGLYSDYLPMKKFLLSWEMRKNILFGGNFFLFKPFLSFCLARCWKGYLLALSRLSSSPAGLPWLLLSTPLQAHGLGGFPDASKVSLRCLATAALAALLGPQRGAPGSRAPFTS